MGDRWTPRRESTRGNGSIHTGAVRHGRQKSLSEAIRSIRGRHGSVSANAQEIADALKAPVSPKLIVSSDTQRPLVHHSLTSV